tara:strand:+ start:247 stop:561 length:315 start_codon:yes stop_codon:yes gene_type:complete
MKLIILGKEKPSNKEIEIFSKNEYGFDVILTKQKDNKKITYRNIHEYHHLWDKNKETNSNLIMKNRIAIESDIHQSGYVPWDIFNKFSRIEVVESDKIYENFYN